MTAKTCTRCEQQKPQESFAKHGTWNGTQLYKSVCKDCMNAAMRADRPPAETRVHFENVTRERCPHGEGIRKIAVKGWGYLGATR